MLDLKNHLFLDVLFLPKKCLFIKELDIKSIRLLLVLSSLKDKTIYDLDFKTKIWINSRTKYSIKSFEKMENILKKHYLIKEDGTGLDLVNEEERFLIYKNPNILQKCKNKRQLLFLSYEMWHKGKSIILSKQEFEVMFGSDFFRVNENIKRTNKQLCMEFIWEEKKNSIFITKIKQEILISKVKKTDEIEWDFGK